MKRQSAVLPIAAILSAACASYPAPAPVGPGHPASPDAPSPPVTRVGIRLTPSDLDRPVTAPAAPGEGAESHPRPQPALAPGHTHPSPETGSALTPSGDAIYSCPMHPEVKENEPGRCPKCGMRLVEQRKSEGRRP